MLRLAGGIADGVLLNYLPAVARAVVRRAGARRRRRRGLRVRALRRDRPRPLRRRGAQGPLELRGRRRVRRTSSRAAGSPTTSPSSARSGRRASATPRSPRSATRGSTKSRSWATPRTCAPRSRRTATGGAKPIVFALRRGRAADGERHAASARVTIGDVAGEVLRGSLVRRSTSGSTAASIRTSRSRPDRSDVLDRHRAGVHRVADPPYTSHER